MRYPTDLGTRPLPYGLLTACCVLGLLAGTSLQAQTGEAGQVEMGSFGTYSSFDNVSLGLDRRMGAGGRLGLFLSQVFSLEATGDYTRTDSGGVGPGVDVARIGGTLFAHVKVADWNSVYLGAGYERLFYRGALQGDDNGAHVILGDRIPLGGRVAIRLEGRAAYYPNSPFQVAGDQVVNLAATFGLSIYSFGGPPRDSDGDQIADKRDLCPATPIGARVDPQGCPSDDDGDHVLTGLDSCPDTPRGATVDAFGCPSDADGDRVLDGRDSCADTPAGAMVDGAGCPLDGDGDGTYDGLDQCPASPAGATVDASGCAADADGDGVADGADRCEATPAGETVDPQGCPLDPDGDGVPTHADQCPGTPSGTPVDETGCEVPDTDNDGVGDNLDRCPSTSVGHRVDEVGCPILFVVEQGERRPLVLEGVTFASGRSVLKKGSHAVLDEVAGSLLAHPLVRVEIAGHTDATGSDRTNNRLSRARAEAVMAYLLRLGVDPSRLEARGYGSSMPIATNRTKAGRAQNRRVELRVIPE